MGNNFLDAAYKRMKKHPEGNYEVTPKDDFVIHGQVTATQLRCDAAKAVILRFRGELPRSLPWMPCAYRHDSSVSDDHKTLCRAVER